MRDDSSSASATATPARPSAPLDDNGTAYSGATYDPWGSPERGSVGTFGFTGELQQGDQVYLRARWYNANNGTFTSKDPFEGNPQQPYSLHPYQYGYSVPTTWSDPLGLFCIKINHDLTFGTTCHHNPILGEWFVETSVVQFVSGYVGQGLEAGRALGEPFTSEGRALMGQGIWVLVTQPGQSGQVLKQSFINGSTLAGQGAMLLVTYPEEALGSITAKEWGGIAFDITSMLIGNRSILRSKNMATAKTQGGAAKLAYGQVEQICYDAAKLVKVKFAWLSKIINPVEELLGGDFQHVALRNLNGTWTDTSLFRQNMSSYVNKLPEGPSKTRLTNLIDKYNDFDTFNQELYKSFLEELVKVVEETQPKSSAPRPSIPYSQEHIPGAQTLDTSLDDFLRNLGE